MSTVPPSIAVLSQILKDAGHRTSLFDTTFYKFDDEIAIDDVDEKKARSLNFRPFRDADDDDLHFRKSTRSAVEDLVSAVDSFSPDLIAVSCTETTFRRGIALARAVRHRGIPTIFGGVFPTFAPHLALGFEEVDMVCVGEGENAIADLADRLASGRDYSDVTNLWIKQRDGTVRKNPISKPVDINRLPPVTDIGLFGEKRFYRPMGGKIRRLLPVETHRGCPYPCAFCNSPSQNVLYGGRISYFRKKRMDLVKQEIESHVRQWKVEYIYFWADTFLAWSDREFDEFCDMYSDIKLPFWCQTRIETITERRLKRLKDVGLDRMTFGLEHGNEAFRREIVRRPYRNEDAIRIMQIPAGLDITFSVNNMIGFPDETRALAFDTIEMNRHFKTDNLSCSVFVPFHGTELRRYAEEKGLISPDVVCTVSNADDSLLRMPQWSVEDISRLRTVFAMYVKFPRGRWPEIFRAELDPDLHAKLSEEYVRTFWSSPKAKIEDDLAEAARGIL
ncbi:MAG: B12-binding domain-containing radical SAM protein [Nitrospirae bacterium]|nr:B12-binding domain-containing radical SAM protein [Nitrospirota bacterium]